MPGVPIAYWVSADMARAFEASQMSEYADLRQGLITGDNERFMRSWFECALCKISLDGEKNKWYIHYKGGDYRKWYGNNQLVVNWENDGTEICNFRDSNGKLRSRPQNIKYYFREGFTWSALTASSFSVRYMPSGGIFAAKGAAGYLHRADDLYYVIGFCNSVICNKLLSVLSQTLDYNPGTVAQIPTIIDSNEKALVTELARDCISISQVDWNSFESSWAFVRHPIAPSARLKQDQMESQFRNDRMEKFGRLSWHYGNWQKECETRFNTLKSNEEELNRIFIDIYGLQDELTPEVEDKDVTVRRADLGRDIRSLISYAVGCMFGRYSLDVDGLAYAGGEWDSSKYSSFIPDKDNILPITDEEYFPDDIVGLFCAWLKKVYGEDTLEANLDFIAKALGNKGNTSREVIRNYFLNDFFKDHCQTYSVTGSGKRPIYWLFDSGKQNGFKALVYMHRYDENTIGNLRIDYLHRMERVYDNEIARMQDIIDNSKIAREVTQSTKRREKLQKQLKECKEYDERIAHLALARIPIDLDDGVKVNYEKVQTVDGVKYPVLAKI